MADTVQGTTGPIDPSSPMAFLLGGGGGMPSLEEIKRRRAIAAALATRQKGYPKTFGEGLTYLGESVGDVLSERRLAEQEKAYREGKAADPLLGPPGTGGRPVATESVVPDAAPTVALPGFTAELSPEVDAQRNQLASLLSPEGVVQQNPMAGVPSRAPLGSQLASLSPTGTMSDAPPVMPRMPSPMPPAPLGAMPPEPPNPPTPTDIAPMPTLVAQAGGGAPAVPGGATGGPAPSPPVAAPALPPGMAPPAIPSVFDKPVAAPPVPVTPMAPIDPAVMQPMRPKPSAPQMDTRPTDDELRGLAILRKYPGDEDAEKRAGYLIGFGKTRREAEYARRVKIFDADLAEWEKEQAARQTYSRDFPKLQREHTEATEKFASERRMRELFPDGIDKAYGRAKESSEKVAQLPAAQMAISGVRELLNSDRGMFTGAPANMKLSLAKWAQAVGAPYDPRVDNTEAFKGLITPILAALRPAIVGSGAQSQPEFKLLQDAAAGNISLERGSIEKILAAVERLNAQAAVQHHKVLMANSRGEPNVQAGMFGNYELPIEKFIPPGKVEILRREIARHGTDAAAVKAEMEEFDRTYFTPGLAQKFLMRR